MDIPPKPILLSVKPRFADLIFDGRKKAELRRRFSISARDQDVFIYVTSPEKVLRGGFRVERIWHGTPDAVWSDVRRIAQVKKSEYKAYYAESAVAYALAIADVWECDTPLCFQTLNRQFQKFVAPQSWRYVRPEEYGFFMSMKREAKLPPARAA